MDVKALVAIIVLGVMLVAALVGLLVALFNGSMKKFVVEKMAEADSHLDWTADQKRKYVIEAFVEKYKIIAFLLLFH